MRTSHAIVGCLVFGIALTTWAEPNFTKGFVRDPGTFTLNDSGTKLEVSHAKKDRLSWTLVWRTSSSGDGFSEKGEVRFSKPEYFKGEGWFVYIESPSRLWLFDGVRQFDILQRGEKDTGTYSAWSKAFRDHCPPEAWNAIPEAVRSEMAKRAEP